MLGIAVQFFSHIIICSGNDLAIYVIEQSLRMKNKKLDRISLIYRFDRIYHTILRW